MSFSWSPGLEMNALKLTRTTIFLCLLLLFIVLVIFALKNLLNPKYGMSYEEKKDAGKFPMFTLCKMPMGFTSIQDNISTFADLVKSLPAWTETIDYIGASKFSGTMIANLTDEKTLNQHNLTLNDVVIEKLTYVPFSEEGHLLRCTTIHFPTFVNSSVMLLMEFKVYTGDLISLEFHERDQTRHQFDVASNFYIRGDNNPYYKCKTA